ncbi:MAG: RNA methyltransferase [Candidatus Sumerlaeia bacterium]|nr:RNA methyltransferase [Candidatus Sumerlaeia bacterium]
MEALAPSNPWIKAHAPHARARAGLVLAEGARLVDEALAGDWPVLALALSAAEADRHADLAARARGRRAEVRIAQAAAMARLSDQPAPPPVAALLEPPALDTAECGGAERWLALDSVADPGNAGTLLRTALAFGYRTLLCGGGVQPWNEKFVRASGGAIFREGAIARWTPPRTDLCAQLARRGGAVLVLDGEAEETLTEALAALRGGPLALVVGSEAAGARRADWPGARWARLPMPGGAESLNAAVAGAIALWEARK